MTVDGKAVLKGTSERTSCTTFKRLRDSLVPEIEFIPVVDGTWGQFSFPGLPPPPPLKMMRSKVSPSAVLVLKVF